MISASRIMAISGMSYYHHQDTALWIYAKNDQGKGQNKEKRIEKVKADGGEVDKAGGEMKRKGTRGDRERIT